jgi:hypothetical protein
MMRRHPFSRPTDYTHQLATGAVVAAAAIYVALFVGFLYLITPSFLHWG